MPAMTEAKTYVHFEEGTGFRIGRTRVSLDSVVAAYLEGHSPETIHKEYPTLSLEEVYGAIAFYLGNQERVHRYLDGQQERWEELRRQLQQRPNPAVERLRTLKKPGGSASTLSPGTRDRGSGPALDCQ